MRILSLLLLLSSAAAIIKLPAKVVLSISVYKLHLHECPYRWIGWLCFMWKDYLCFIYHAVFRTWAWLYLCSEVIYLKAERALVKYVIWMLLCSKCITWWVINMWPILLSMFSPSVSTWMVAMMGYYEMVPFQNHYYLVVLSLSENMYLNGYSVIAFLIFSETEQW